MLKFSLRVMSLPMSFALLASFVSPALLDAQSPRPAAPPFNPSRMEMQSPPPEGVAIRAGRLLLAPIALGAAVFLHPAGRRVVDRLLGSSPGVQAVAAVAGFIVAAGLLSAGVHLVIRAFELGRPTSGPGAG